MNRFTTFAALLSFVAAPVLADTPFCAALSDTDQLPAKYAKRGPFHADGTSGWIIGRDQTKTNFDATAEVLALWAEIRAAFAEKGVTLMVLAAPPRPLFAPTAAQPQGYDARAAQAAFQDYIAALNGAGIIAADLSTFADKSEGQGYYFARDTHWTPRGAALSALALADQAGVSAPTEAISFDGTYSEKGSLSTVVEQTCGTRPEAETVAAPIYAAAGGADALLGDTRQATIALVGTSFSDRYKTDSYQVAAAVAHAFSTDVANYSVTGGGMVGAMEAFLRAGHLEAGHFDTLIWEAPYTSPLTDPSGLRQVLGALQDANQGQTIYEGPLKKDWMSLKNVEGLAQAKGIEIETPGTTDGRLNLELYDADNNKLRIKLVKSDRVAATGRSDVWSLSLAALPLVGPTRLKIKFDSPVGDAKVRVLN